MIKSKILPTIVLLCIAPVVIAAQTNFVTIDGHRVHPTRILAKYSDQDRLTARSPLTAAFGLKELRRFSRIPGLTVFEDEQVPVAHGLTVAAEEVNDRRQSLLDRIAAMRASGLFEYVEPDYIVSKSLVPDDAAFVDGTLWGLQNLGQSGGKVGADIDAVRAWDLTTGSTNVIVAVIDTGIRYTHQDLASQMWVNPGEIPGNQIDDDGNGVVDDVYGINAVADNGDPMDDGDHGSHVSGTIGAAANNGHPHVGVTWNVQLMACKFLNNQGFGATSDAIECIDYAVNMGAKILNNSWGGGPFSFALFAAIDRARRADVLFVAAAGNSGEDGDLIPHYPANYNLDNIISVAALDRSDNLATFSNFGRTTVDLGAPGVSIFSCTSGSDADYQEFDGTSMAAPHVSGVAALVMSHFPGAPMSEVRDRILFSVVPVNALNNRTVTGGRANAYNALTITGGPNLSLAVNPPSGSAILAGANTPIFVRVTSLFGVRDATVTGTVSGLTNLNLTFANDGTAPDAIATDDTYTANLSAPGTTGTLMLTIVASAPGKVTTTNTVTYSVIPRPSNDDFANATKAPAPGAFYLSNNRFATLEVSEPVHAGVVDAVGSLWWAWTAVSNGPVLIDTTGSAIDTVIAVYRGNSLASLIPVAAVDNVGTLNQAHLSFNATNGITYRIAIAGADDEAFGSIRLRIAPNGRLDTQPPGVVITGPLSGITVTTNQVLISGTAFDPQPDSSGIREVLVRLNAGFAVAANGTTNWSTLVRLQPGRNFIVARADDFAGHSSSLMQIQVTYQQRDPVNDLFADAIPLQGASGTVSVSNTNATREFGEPLHAGIPGGKSVWWTFTPASDGVLNLTTTNSGFDTLLAVYLGPRVSELTPIISNDDAFEGQSFSKVTQAVNAGQTYRIAVDGFDGVSGNVSLNYGFASSTLHQVTVNASPGGTVTVGSGTFPTGTPLVLEAIPDFGFQFTGWQGSTSSVDNPLSVVVDRDLTFTAGFVARTFTDGFESGNFSALPWTFGGNAPWVVQSNSVSLGRFAARSGAIAHGQTSSLFVSRVCPAGVGAFDVRVSSEAEWDRLEFYVNGVFRQRWSGDAQWQTYQFAVPGGTNSFEWRYAKDFSLSAGLDAAFLDNFDLPTAPTAMQLLSYVSGGPEIRLLGQSSYTYVIQASSDLLNWQAISTNVAVNGVIQIKDPTAANYRVRFYRGVITP